MTFIDNRGRIEHLFDIQSGMQISSVCFIESVQGSQRASHYHLVSGHYCILTSGKLVYYEKMHGSNQSPIMRTIEPWEVWYTGPNIDHLMVFEENSDMWVFGTGLRNQKDYEKDTIKLDYQLDALLPRT